jgi:L-aspartate oxidase
MTHITIIGGGIAGSYAALSLPENISVTIYLKGEKPECSSYLSQGGIAAAVTQADSPTSHAQDTFAASHHQADKKAVKILTEEGPERIQELIDLGCPFDKDFRGKLQIGHEAAHSHPRIIHAGGDATGKKIMAFLWKKISQKKNIKIVEHATVFDIQKNSEKFSGKFFHTKNHIIQNFQTDFCIIATGGYGQVFAHATCPSTITGDGIYLAEKLGAKIRDMAYVQFHPTAFTEKIPALKGRQFLISEAIRGEGGILKNKAGERFMEKIHPQKELAPRDVVARAIYQEINTHHTHHVYLDISHKTPDFIQKRFPTIYQTCLKKNIDITKEAIPVRPTVHYCMGGVVTNLHGETGIKNLFAIGEVASVGIHGANRLASNSLLEALVFGYRAAQKIVEYNRFCSFQGDEIRSPDLKNQTKNIPISLISSEKITELQKIQKQVRQLLWTHCGIIRTREKLQAAQKNLKIQEKNFLEVMEQVPLYPPVFQTQVTLHIAQKIIGDALDKKESVGVHYLS